TPPEGEDGFTGAFNRSQIEAIARRHAICPFEFSLDLAQWVDCVICDYNYAFDPRVYLRRFFDHSTDPYLFLVDEVHNLPDRARAMFSAELNKQTVLDLRTALKSHLPDLSDTLTPINQALLDKRKLCEANEETTLVEYGRPDPLLQAIRTFTYQAELWLAQNQPAPFRTELLDFYFQCNAYLRTADDFDTFYVSYFERLGKNDLKAKLYCLDPAPLLTNALARSQSTIFFSATLMPMDYFEQLLTGTTDNPKLMLPSPFPDENVSLLIQNRISTKYANRADSYAPIAETIATVCSSQPGNYLIFFPSYAYLTEVLERFQLMMPQATLLVQDRGMDEAAREDFLAQFSQSTDGMLIGFAVMGGIFGEGIDLVGKQLIGAIIVGVGLPQIGLEPDLIKAYFNQQNQRGFEYAYQYPGFNRVLQAAGRVIRTETDRGVIILIDERFTQYRYKRAFPKSWQTFQAVQNNKDIQELLSDFWSTQ
ncbi:MAG: ATP-dependent DNA helicase, partial [Chloroflexota bacterium]